MPDGSSRYDIIGEFRDAFVDAGLVAPGEIISDGKWHRCDVVGKRPRNRAGRYKLYLDRWPAGVLQSFVESRVDIWHPKRERGRKLNDDEREERKRYYEEKRVEAETDLAKRQAAVASSAEWQWSGLTEGATPYTSRKQVGTHGTRRAAYGTDLYVPACDLEGKIWCLQTIFPDGTKRFPFGSRVKGHFFALGTLVDGQPIQIAEGFATGGSAFETNQVATVVAFFSTNLLPVARALHERYPNSLITILADDDAQTEQERGFNPGIEAAIEAAISVNGKMAVPQFGPHRDLALTDFNDLHCSVGLDVVREQIAAARDPVERAYPAPKEPLGLGEARERLDRILEGFVRVAPTWRNAIARTEEGYIDLNDDPPAYCIAMPPGIGKTTSILRRVVRPLQKVGLDVLIAVPRHRLGKQIVEDLAPYVVARVFQSRGADDLEIPGQLMCLEKDRVQAIEGALGEVDGLACKRGADVCEYFDTCGYQRQQRPPKPEVWVVAHQLLFRARPSFIPKPDVLVIDEGFHCACFEDDVAVELNDLLHNRVWPKGSKPEDEADLRTFALRVYDVLVRKLSEQRRCQIPRAWFDGIITAEDARTAYKLEWARKLQIDDVHPGMPADQAIERAHRRTDHNQQVKRLCKFWEQLAATLEGEPELSLYLQLDRDCRIPYADDRTAPAIVVSSRLELHKDLARCPVLHADAFLDPLIVEHFFSRIVFHRLDVRMPRMTTFAIEQIVDRVIGKSANSDLLVEEARRLIETEAADTSGPIGVICNKQLELALHKAGRSLPRNVRLGITVR